MAEVVKAVEEVKAVKEEVKAMNSKKRKRTEDWMIAKANAEEAEYNKKEKANKYKRGPGGSGINGPRSRAFLILDGDDKREYEQVCNGDYKTLLYRHHIGGKNVVMILFHNAKSLKVVEKEFDQCWMRPCRWRAAIYSFHPSRPDVLDGPFVYGHKDETIKGFIQDRNRLADERKKKQAAP